MKIEGSSHINRAEYDVSHRMLVVGFKSGGATSYQNVPPERWDEFQKSDSKGKFLHAEIIPHHRGWPAKDYKCTD